MSHDCVPFVFIHQLQKQNYRQEKKRAAKELFSALKDPSVVIMSNWLKVSHTHACTHTQEAFES